MIQTTATNIERRGPYVCVDVWSDKRLRRVTLDRYFNLVSIKTFTADGRSWYHLYYWRQEWHRAYKRKKPFGPLHTDIITCAITAAKERRHEVK